MPLGGLWGSGERIHVAELSLANPGSSTPEVTLSV